MTRRITPRFIWDNCQVDILTHGKRRPFSYQRLHEYLASSSVTSFQGPFCIQITRSLLRLITTFTLVVTASTCLNMNYQSHTEVGLGMAL